MRDPLTTKPSWFRRIALSSVALFGLGPLALGGFFYTHQESLLFYPGGSVEHDPGEIDLGFEDLHLETADGETLGAWWVPAEAPDRGAILYCHGNAGNIGNRLHVIESLHALGFGVLVFDYRGYGESSGAPDEAGVYADADAAWQHLVETRGIPPEHIVVWGRSLGGAIAGYLAGREDAPPPGALVLESTFTSIPDIGREVYPWLPSFIGRLHFDTKERLARSRAPLLLGHSPDDSLIGIHHGRALFEASQSTDKRWVDLSGDHNGGHLSRPEHRATVSAFLADALR